MDLHPWPFVVKRRRDENTSLFDDTQTISMTLYYKVAGTLAGFSFVASLIIIISYLLIKPLRKHPTNLVFWLSICDLFFSFKFLLTSIIPGSASLARVEWICYSQAIFSQFWGTASISWNGMISLNLLFNMRNPFVNTQSYNLWYHLWAWGLSLTTTIFMIAFNTNGYEVISINGDGTCWTYDLWQLLFFAPLCLYFIISFVTITIASIRIRTIRTQLNSSTRRAEVNTPNERTNLLSSPVDDLSQRHIQEENRLYFVVLLRMVVYVGLFVLLWSFPLVHRTLTITHKATDQESPNETPLQYLDVIGICLQGLSNAVVYSTNPSFWRLFTRKIRHVRNDITSRIEHNISHMQSNRVSHLSEISFGSDSESETSTKKKRHSSVNNNVGESQRIDIIIRRYVISCIVSGIIDNVEDITRAGRQFREVMPSDFEEKLDSRPIRESHQHTFTDYAPLVFMRMRQTAGVDNETYVEALEPRNFIENLGNQKFSDGRSGSFFVFSPCKNFIVKTLTVDEAALVIDILPKLYQHMMQNPDTLINRFFGLHAISVLHGETTYVAVMENVINTRLKLDRRYDLKGSWVNREVGRAHDEGSQGMDLDLKTKLNLDPHTKSRFLSQIRSDSEFFTRLNIMDYSLLLAIHNVTSGDPYDTIDQGPFHRRTRGGVLSRDGREVYFFGIIDVLQLWDRKKKMERFFKVYVRNKSKWGVSAQEPSIYSQRFVEGMTRIIQ
ncbi:hypothetical protein PROFUN_08991 [Planoprotostelium fungivorum]|uniref:Uncharacterized protein n=1 Tax=Planoprotostelium fungivorum TaxID=1890364 RepID=A0A2P6NIK2_9EUKA|nr:hypothetical protein PROFUN_08991 [Planoprotostelium fungivorum]